MKRQDLSEKLGSKVDDVLDLAGHFDGPIWLDAWNATLLPDTRFGEAVANAAKECGDDD